MDAEPKRRGRPPLDPEARKDGNLTFRSRRDLRSKLEQAARENGRTVSKEAEHRLTQSFLANDLRQIVREEIAAALKERNGLGLSEILELYRSSAIPIRNKQIFDRNHLPS